jgi:hypothetical protein
MPNPSFRNLGFALLVLSLGLAGELSAASTNVRMNSDKPTRGRWDFAPQLLWQVTGLEGQALEVPAELRVMADGTLFLRDFPRDFSFVLDADGTFIRAIAPTGEKPGELSHYANCFPTPGQMAICAMDAIHFFDGKGDFIAAFPNNIFASFPGVFLTDREFLSSPGQVFSRASGAMEIRRIQLERGQSEVFTTISTEGAPEPPASNLAITWRGVTPHIEMAFDPERGLVYIGRSDRYAIQVLDLKGKLKQTFGVDRTPLPLTPEAKQAQFGDLALPAEQKQSLMDSQPDVLTYYRRIQVVGDLILVMATTGIGRQPTQVQIDVFSRDGEYLYRAPITFTGNEHIFGSPENLVIHENSFYVSLENSEGNKRVARYRIRLPEYK